MPPARLAQSLRVAGRDKPTPFIVHDHEKCWWTSADPGTRPRKIPRVESVVLHHTGGEGNAIAVYNTLKRRKLSCHLYIDQGGHIWQYADLLSTVTYHAGFMNGESIGIEIANRGRAPEQKNWSRGGYTAEVNGHAYNFLRFYPAQVAAADSLCKWLCEEFGIPFRFPMDDEGAIRTTTMDRKELDSYRGLLGHLHVSKRKIDPSPHLMEDLAFQTCFA